jgi:ribosomal protein S18 acetylase RimI-like enzyme
MVVLRDVRRRDLRKVSSFATTAVVYVGPTDDDDDPSAEDRVTCEAGARLAEDDSGILGYARTLVTSRANCVEAELISLLIAPHAREWAIDRLLVDDARREVAARGVTRMSVLVRPPVDVLFRGLGGEAHGIVGSWSGAADPRILLEMPCPR